MLPTIWVMRRPDFKYEDKRKFQKIFTFKICPPQNPNWKHEKNQKDWFNRKLMTMNTKSSFSPAAAK